MLRDSGVVGINVGWSRCPVGLSRMVDVELGSFGDSLRFIWDSQGWSLLN